MSNKILVQFPSYVWLELPTAMIQAIANSNAYDYDYETQTFYRAEDICGRMELKVADGKKFSTMTRQQYRNEQELLKAQQEADNQRDNDESTETQEI
jgi:hypothetical protein